MINQFLRYIRIEFGLIYYYFPIHVLGRKGQKKQSIWPTKLSLGFLGNTPKGKRGFSSKKPNFSSKRPSPFSGSSSIKVSQFLDA